MKRKKNTKLGRLVRGLVLVVGIIGLTTCDNGASEISSGCYLCYRKYQGKIYRDNPQKVCDIAAGTELERYLSDPENWHCEPI